MGQDDSAAESPAGMGAEGQKEGLDRDLVRRGFQEGGARGLGVCEFLIRHAACVECGVAAGDDGRPRAVRSRRPDAAGGCPRWRWRSRCGSPRRRGRRRSARPE